MDNYPLPKYNSRIGYQYFRDSSHYRQQDINIWLPFLKTLGASWISLTAPFNRAIPENFISSFISSGIEPIIQYESGNNYSDSMLDIKLILKSYAKWGIHYVSFFDRPNQQVFWDASEWARDDLVDRFLDRFVPVARMAVSEGLIPVFPPLTPGGDYWDLVFLRSALRGLLKRGLIDLVDSLSIGAIAASNGKPLTWGKGGFTRWSGNRPYFTPPESEDHCGLNIFEWYSSIVEEELGDDHPIILFNVGKPLSIKEKIESSESNEIVINQTLSILKALYVTDEGTSEITIPPHVIAGCFVFHSLPQGFSFDKETDLTALNEPVLLINLIQSWLENQNQSREKSIHNPYSRPSQVESLQNPNQEKSINHYLLIPLHPFGIADWDLDAVRPFILQNHPTVGFAFDEAVRAKHVTILETKPFDTTVMVNQLESAGCMVDTLSSNGMNIAP